MLDLDELEAKAKAAGPAWVKDGPWAETCVQPAEVLALIRELREARASRAEMLARLQEEAKLHVNFMLGEHAKVVTERDEARAAVAAEREACAHRLEVRAALYTKDGTVGSTIASCAALIRARGAKGGE